MTPSDGAETRQKSSRVFVARNPTGESIFHLKLIKLFFKDFRYYEKKTRSESIKKLFLSGFEYFTFSYEPTLLLFNTLVVLTAELYAMFQKR